MTALAITVRDNGISAAADAAHYRPSGELVEVRPKLVCLDEQRAMVASVGVARFADAFAALAVIHTDFDAILKRAIDLAQVAYKMAAFGIAAEHLPPRSTLVLGGWSAARGRYEAYRIFSAPLDDNDPQTRLETVRDAWTLVPITGAWAAPVLPEVLLRSCHLRGPAEAPAPSGDDLVNYVCASRALTGRSFAVGGRVDLVQMERHQTRHQVAHTWPDRIGEPIDPSRGHLFPSRPPKRLEPAMTGHLVDNAVTAHGSVNTGVINLPDGTATEIASLSFTVPSDASTPLIFIAFQGSGSSDQIVSGGIAVTRDGVTLDLTATGQEPVVINGTSWNYTFNFTDIVTPGASYTYALSCQVFGDGSATSQSTNCSLETDNLQR